MKDVSVMIHEAHVFTANPVYLGVFESRESELYKKIINDANKDLKYFNQKDEGEKNKYECYQVGEYVLFIINLGRKYKKGDKVVLKLKESFGAAGIKGVVPYDEKIHGTKSFLRKGEYVYIIKKVR